MDRLSEVTKGKTIGILAFGKSLSNLEERILEFKDLDIVWVSLNNFDIIEKFILSKINKSLDIAVNFAYHFPWVTKEIIIPNINKRLENHQITILSRGFYERSLRDKLGTFSNSEDILFIDDFWVDNPFPPPPKKWSPTDLMRVFCKTESTIITLLLLFLLYKPKRIILFGVDGAVVQEKETMLRYYRYDDIKDRRLTHSWNIQDVTEKPNIYFKQTFKKALEIYQIPDNEAPEILNCSPGTIYTCFKNITYDETINLLKEKK